ncbi:hypothetical protein BCU70_01830 [Vibrio sp. 10N.286.49.C2]|uniref:glycolate oxidase subunit GlcF n=1 Tax=unclassified Vibrio TaxID=2614977 RepID=UPI000C853BE9|nr:MULTISPECIES: glycolate oxidase subunit GlcF [unclassified Vibrio]PMH42919.1 hypothetical protein BCU70_01830 [Vibrio sp. 10N.286.49.C2]PMH53742.1 hypothetical protein BCU66_13005 [Vibrio sp. 10N.286.49.B1]PMH84075.1 hypothetical protein BCU58_01335 [Vibrio sp. 10N.286.48.B7]
MLIKLDPVFKDKDLGTRGTTIIKRCVHRGFCNSHCPTFIQTGDQKLSPRGRIYLIRDFLQGAELTHEIQQSIELCIACRSCVQSCPAGVEVNELIALARTEMRNRLQLTRYQRWKRWVISQIIPYPERFRIALSLAQAIRPVLPTHIRNALPAITQPNLITYEKKVHNPAQKMTCSSVIVLAGCAQKTLTPNTTIAAVNLLRRLGMDVVEIKKETCCGAVHKSLGYNDSAKQQMRQNMDQWWPHISKGVSAIIATSSSCELALSEYKKTFEQDQQYQDKAASISGLTTNLAELLLESDLKSLQPKSCKLSVALHTPCSLRNGLNKHKLLTQLLEKLSVRLIPVNHDRICCGSGGVYSLLHEEMGNILGDNKSTALEANNPDIIITANTSCQQHLMTKTSVPVVHWVEFLHQYILD